jgi:hypothetical protein
MRIRNRIPFAVLVIVAFCAATSAPIGALNHTGIGHTATTGTQSTAFPVLGDLLESEEALIQVVLSSPAKVAQAPAAAVPAPAPVPAPATPAPAPVAPPVTDATSTSTADWHCIIQAESSGNYTDTSGAFGILVSTWDSSEFRAIWAPYGNFYVPGDAPLAVQSLVALTIFHANHDHFAGSWNDYCTMGSSATLR